MKLLGSCLAPSPFKIRRSEKLRKDQRGEKKSGKSDTSQTGGIEGREESFGDVDSQQLIGRKRTSLSDTSLRRLTACPVQPGTMFWSKTKTDTGPQIIQMGPETSHVGFGSKQRKSVGLIRRGVLVPSPTRCVKMYRKETIRKAEKSPWLEEVKEKSLIVREARFKANRPPYQHVSIDRP